MSRAYECQGQKGLTLRHARGHRRRAHQVLPSAVVTTADPAGAGARPHAERLRNTDVLTWWGTRPRLGATRSGPIHARVLEGMGLIVLHSGILEDIQAPHGTSCSLTWREADERGGTSGLQPGPPMASIDRLLSFHGGMYGAVRIRPREQVFHFLVRGRGGLQSGCAAPREGASSTQARHETYPRTTTKRRA